MHDTCSSVSTVHYDDPTKSRVIEIGRKKTCSRVCVISDKSTGSKRKEDVELATEAEERPQNITSKEIQGLLPNLNDTSASSVLDAIEAWKSILGNLGIHRDLWGSITLSKLKRKTLLNLQQSVKRDCNLDEICGALENKCNMMRIMMK